MRKSILNSLNRTATIEAGEHGGKRSASACRLDLMPPAAMLIVGNVLMEGAVSHDDKDGSNWRRIPYREQLNHALVHIYAFLMGDDQDDHLGHATTRMMMALDTYVTEMNDGLKEVDPETSEEVARTVEAGSGCGHSRVP